MEKKKFAKQLGKLILVLLILGALFFFSGQKLLAPIENAGAFIFQPFQRIGFSFSQKIRQGISFFSSIGELKHDNENLMEENLEYQYRLTELSGIKKENDLLRQELNLAPREQLALTSAWVIGQDGTKLGSWLTIDKGQADGVRVNQAVVVHQGILVGKVTEVRPHESKVTLLSDFESAVNARDMETDTRGIVRGEYGLGIVLDMVDQTENLQVGDVVATSGLGGGTKADLMIGKIQSIRTSDDKLFQKAVLTPAVQYSDLSVVFLVGN